MADTSKKWLLLRGGIRHITTALLFTRGSKQVPDCVAYVILFKRVNFPQYFACLHERIFNCCNVLMLS